MPLKIRVEEIEKRMEAYTIVNPYHLCDAQLTHNKLIDDLDLLISDAKVNDTHLFIYATFSFEFT